jgi:hypothetical protein
VYRIDPNAIVTRPIEGEILAVDLQNSRYLSINPTATELWPLLERGSTFEELLQALTSRWKISNEQARADLDRFLGWLTASGLLVTT